MNLGTQLGLRPRELVSFVGAGGKSTLMLRLAGELVDDGHRVVITTTTKMATDQIPTDAMVVREPDAIDGDFNFLLGSIDGPKVLGVELGMVDELFSSEEANYVLVEADGARRMGIKAPNDNEPVYPAYTSLAVIVTSLDVIGGTIGEVAHRPERVATLLAKDVNDDLNAGDLVSVVTSRDGGLARVPTEARVVVALTGEYDESRAVIDAIAEHPRVERVVSVA